VSVGFDLVMVNFHADSGIQYIEALRRLLTNGKKFQRTIHILWGPGKSFHIDLSYQYLDEEIGGGDGMKLFVKTPEFKKLNIGFTLDEGIATPDDAYKVYYAERNLWWVKVSCIGQPGHGSKFQDNTAAEKLVKLISISKLIKFLAIHHQQFSGIP
jgi:acetylornithine deacetylase/succinyl-diaminopimelate desuccinylase-like protein